MSDIATNALLPAAGDRQPPRRLSPRGFGSRERLLKRCRELMVAGTFRPTRKQLETPTLTQKVIHYYFDTLEDLYLEALDATTAITIARLVLNSTKSWIETEDIARVAHAAVFGTVRT